MKQAFLVLLLSFWIGRARADEEGVAPDAVVVASGAAAQIDELASLGGSVSERLRSAGLSLLRQPGPAFERLGSRTPRTMDTRNLETLVEQLTNAVAAKNLERVGQLAYEVMARSEQAPEALIDGPGPVRGTVRYALLQACFEGVSAFLRLDQLTSGRRLIEYCSSLPWLVAHDDYVRPDVRAVLLRDVRAFEFELSVAGSAGKAWLQGAPIAMGKSRFRTLPGARLAVAVDCGAASRVHWVVPDVHASKLALRVDCAFDAVVHSDDRGVWLSSSMGTLVPHGLEVARALGAARVVIVSKEADRYVLRARSVGGGRGASVTLPLVHGDRHLAAAVDELLQTKPDGGPHVGAAVQATEPGKQGASRTRARSGWIWAGGAALVLGVGAEVGAWFLYRARAQAGEELRQLPADSDRSQKWEDLRAPMLGLTAGGAGLASAGVALLASSGPNERTSWWVAGAAGAAGTGLAVWGGVDIAKGEPCNSSDPRACVDEEQRRDRGALLLMAAVPFLMLPVTKLARAESARLRGESEISLAATPHGVRVFGSW